MSWINEMFNEKKAIIGMVHFKALPGDPGYDEVAGMQGIIDAARHDLLALQDGGIDGVVVCHGAVDHTRPPCCGTSGNLLEPRAHLLPWHQFR